MGFKSFILKKSLQMKGVSSDQAESIAKAIEENPEMANSLKVLEDNKDIKALLEKIQKEIEEKKKGGMPEQYAAVQVMGKYKSELSKYRTELAPLMQLMGMGGMGK
jgi:2-phosphoglycerate kinase